jgi:hypothetical protein
MLSFLSLKSENEDVGRRVVSPEPSLVKALLKIRRLI